VSGVRVHRPCRSCGVNDTRSATGLCSQCRPAPAVTLQGDVVHIDGLGTISTHAALALAHKLADAVSDSRTAGWDGR
jgi:hypothetical protein